MSEVRTLKALLDELIACAGVFDVSTDYESDKAELEKATQAIIQYTQTLRDERDEAIEAASLPTWVCDGCGRVSSEGWYWWREDPDSAPQVFYVKQLSVGLRVMMHADHSATMEYLQGEWQGPLTPNEATE